MTTEQLNIASLILKNSDGEPLNKRQRDLYRMLKSQKIESELLPFFKIEIETFNTVFFSGSDRRKYFAAQAQGAYGA